MRQSGILAACGLYALENNIQRLHQDHLLAKRLAESINNINGFYIDLESVETNMIYIDSDMGAKQLMERLADHGIDVLDVGPTAIRAVTHLHVTSEDIDLVIAAFQKLAN